MPHFQGHAALPWLRMAAHALPTLPNGAGIQTSPPSWRRPGCQQHFPSSRSVTDGCTHHA